ncbi:MAG: Gfo/Idh/MocA family oxidoreductase [Pirellulaceae bacterium]|jgi:predicted dehydrogenase|nr:Gfo/Idh/MocA family oxidoreductase [Pirellulaceae bacterium]
MQRRDFLGKMTAAAASFAAPTFVSSDVLGRNGRLGANDRVNVGIIGLGGRARDIAKTCLHVPQMRVVAVCDCFRPRCGQFITAVGKDQKWSDYVDFREMIDKENLDAVMVETTTHARAWATIIAMQAGMDVYIEKPMCLTIEEGRYMVEAARKYGRVTQVGTQQRSMPINNWASDLVKNGAIGTVHTVLAPNFVGPDNWTGAAAQPLPRGGKEGWWDIWTNQAELRPYHPQIHRGWARWRSYDGGGRCYGVTGWGTHSYDQIQRALGADETGPVQVWLTEPVKNMPTGKYDNPKGNPDTGVDYRGLAQPVIGPRAKVRMRFAKGTELRLELDGDWGPGLGAIFLGDKGKIEINRNKIASNPKELVLSPENPGANRKLETQYHIENWIDCIKTRKRCTADIEYGQRSSTLCYLVNIVRDVGQIGKKLNWDPDTERFTNCDEANQMLSRPRRKGHELPALT